MKRRLLVIGLCAALGACAEEFGPPPPPPQRPAAVFHPSEFSWSTEEGSATLHGVVDYSRGGHRYRCGGDAVLTPDAPYSRRRILQLYGSTERADLPVDEVRARQANRPSADYSSFVRKASCDPSGRFTFSGLPSGGWFVIVVAQPAGSGASMALMRRVETAPGSVRTVVLQ